MKKYQNLKMSDMFIVTITKRYTGTRIEGFNVDHHLFDQKDDALKFSHAKACELEKDQVKENKEGIYVGKCSGGYNEWPDYDIYIQSFTIKDGATLSATDSCSNKRITGKQCENCLEIFDPEPDDSCNNCKKRDYCGDCNNYCNCCERYLCRNCYIEGLDEAFYCMDCYKECCL